jgi:hypothetical protein
MKHGDSTYMGKRGDTEINGVTFHQIYDLMVNRVVYYRHGSTDPEAFAQNICCQIEKLMGIYPNVDGMRPEEKQP